MKVQNFYKTGNSSLCIRVLAIPYQSDKYIKLKVDYWSIGSGVYWGNQYSLKRYIKIPKDSIKYWKRFRPKWDKVY